MYTTHSIFMLGMVRMSGEDIDEFDELDRFLREVGEVLISGTDLSPLGVKFLVWLLGAARETDAYPIQLGVDDVLKGFTMNGRFVMGIGGKPAALKMAVAQLVSRGLLRVESPPSAKDPSDGYLFSIRNADKAFAYREAAKTGKRVYEEPVAKVLK